MVQSPECLITHITAIWTLPSVCTLMYLHITSVTECFITHITAIWTLPSMYTLMYLQIPSVTECFITHITAIWTFHSMEHLVLFQCALLTKCCTEGSLLQRKKRSSNIILRKGRKHYQNWVINKLHKYYSIRRVFLSNSVKHVFYCVVLKIHEPNTPFPVARH